MVATNVQVSDIPLCCDLDGSLLKSDILLESLSVLLKKNPAYALVVPFWLLKGKAFLKQQIADRVDLDVALLPYHKPFLEYLREEAQEGRRLVLVTASNEKYARQIAGHLGIFSDVMASNALTNLSGDTKRKLLVKNFGEHGFDYAANAAVDLPVWKQAREAVLVNPLPGVERRARRAAKVTRVFDDRKPSLGAYLKAFRVHQWLKNLLVFVPAIAAHRWETETISLALVAFMAFSFCASSVYLVNDLLDLSSDRVHPHKKYRPLAAGDIPLFNVILLVPILLITSLFLGLFLPLKFLSILVVYFWMTTAYSFYLKKMVLIDVLILAGLYTIRVIAGAAAVSVTVSFWLLAFSVFIFFSLALVKRSTELLIQKQTNSSAEGRGYLIADLEYLHSMGTASGYLAVLVVALYINSRDVVALYSRPTILWFICPLLLYWISRIWIKVGRGEMHDDPLVFAIKDRGSQLVGIAALIILILAV